MGPCSSKISVLVRGDSRARFLFARTETRPHEDTAGRQPYASQKERLHQRPTPLALWSWTFSLWNSEKIRFCYLSHRVHGICNGGLRLIEVADRSSALWRKGAHQKCLGGWELSGAGQKEAGGSGSRSLIPHWNQFLF